MSSKVKSSKVNTPMHTLEMSNRGVKLDGAIVQGEEPLSVPELQSDAEAEYPEHHKLSAVSERSQTCGEFLDWLLGEKGFVLAKYRGNPRYEVLYRENPNVTKLLAEYFLIDEEELEREKIAMLEELRKPR